VIATMADDIAALLDALEISSWVAIVGYAVGAAIAMHFAARRPQRSAALMAMSPATWVAPELRTAPWRASHGPNFADQFRRAAGYVDRILRGEKPADLPVEKEVMPAYGANRRHFGPAVGQMNRPQTRAVHNRPMRSHDLFSPVRKEALFASDQMTVLGTSCCRNPAWAV